MGKLSKLVGAAAVLGATICGAAYYKKKHGMTVTHDSDFEDDLVVDMKQNKKVIDISTEGSDAQNKKVTLTFNTENAKKAVSDTLDTIGDAMEVAKYKIVDVIGEDNVEEAKEKVNNVKNKVVDTIGEENISKAKVTLSDATDKAKTTISNVADKAKDKADEIFTEENIELAKEKMSDVFEKTKDTIKKAGEKVADMVTDKDDSDEIIINSEDVIIEDDSENNIATETDAETSSTPIESVNNFDEDFVGDEDLDSINTIDDELSFDTMDSINTEEDATDTYDFISDSDDYESDNKDESQDESESLNNSFQFDELKELDELEDEDSLQDLDSLEDIESIDDFDSFEDLDSDNSESFINETDSLTDDSNDTYSNINNSDANEFISDDSDSEDSASDDYSDSSNDSAGYNESYESNDIEDEELDELARLEAELETLEAAANEELIDDFDAASTEIEKDYSTNRYSFLEDDTTEEINVFSNSDNDKDIVSNELSSDEIIDDEINNDIFSENDDDVQEEKPAYVYKTPSFLIDDTADDYIPTNTTNNSSDLDMDDFDELDDELLADIEDSNDSSLSDMSIDSAKEEPSYNNFTEESNIFNEELVDNFETKEDDQVIELEEVEDSDDNGHTNSSPISDSHKYDFLADEIDEL